MAIDSDVFVLELGWARAEFGNDAILTIAVYDNPSDMQGWFVARLLVSLRGEANVVPTAVHFKAKTLAEVQEVIPQEYFAWTERHESDDKIIVGCWI